ncbi:TPA: hypothetical protein ACVU4X_002992 [Vibrio parahaemolyticus]
MTQQVSVNSDGWTLISSGNTRGILENTAGVALKVRVETVGAVVSDDEKWGHNLTSNNVFTWERSTVGVDILARTVSGEGNVLVSAG